MANLSENAKSDGGTNSPSKYLSDADLRAGGLRPTRAYVRQPRTKNADKQAEKRKRQAAEKNRGQLNVITSLDPAKRATVACVAKVVEDNDTQAAIDAVTRNDAIRSFVLKIANDPVTLAAAVAAIDPISIDADIPVLAGILTKNPALRGILETIIADPLLQDLCSAVCCDRKSRWVLELVQKRPDVAEILWGLVSSPPATLARFAGAIDLGRRATAAKEVHFAVEVAMTYPQTIQFVWHVCSLLSRWTNLLKKLFFFRAADS